MRGSLRWLVRTDISWTGPGSLGHTALPQSNGMSTLSEPLLSFPISSPAVPGYGPRAAIWSTISQHRRSTKFHVTQGKKSFVCFICTVLPGTGVEAVKEELLRIGFWSCWLDNGNLIQDITLPVTLDLFLNIAIQSNQTVFPCSCFPRGHEDSEDEDKGEGEESWTTTKQSDTDLILI